MSDQQLFEQADKIENAKDEVMAKLARHISYRPQEDHFCREDLEKQFGLTENQARKQIDQWKDAGLIEFAGKYSRWYYYRYVG